MSKEKKRGKRESGVPLTNLVTLPSLTLDKGIITLEYEKEMSGRPRSQRTEDRSNRR